MSPFHSISTCPVCGGGLMGIRICSRPSQSNAANHGADSNAFGAGVFDAAHVHGPHGLVICDECEAIWIEPDSSAPHLYPSAEDPRCPVCDARLWKDSHWASANEIESIGWTNAINRELDWVDDTEIA